MALQLNDLPNELLCKVLNFLDTKEKFSGRLVCSKWKGQIDENVLFHIDINDGNYNLIRRNFGTFRCVKSISIFDYSREDVPVNNLAYLKTLTLRGDVCKLAVTELFSKAVNLACLELFVDHGWNSATIRQTPQSINNYPALRSIKELHIRYDSGYSRKTYYSERAWNEILYEKFPNVHRLIVNLYPNIPRLRGFDYFRLAAGMPKLREFTYQIWNRGNRQSYSYNVPGEEQPFTPKISTELAKLNLIQLGASVAPKDEPIWKIIFAGQHLIQKLHLRNEHNSTEGFPISMILPVLHNSKQSLISVWLQIDAKKSGGIDMEIFASLSSLRELFIQSWPIPAAGQDSDLPKMHNCSRVATDALEKLSVKGFKFSEEDVIMFIKTISNEFLNKVQISPEFTSVWKGCENRMDELGILRYGHSSAHPSRYFSISPNTSKVYVGAALEKYHDYEFVGVLGNDYTRRVRDIILNSQSLQLVSRYMFSYN